jgi:hypothetical protein
MQNQWRNTAAAAVVVILVSEMMGLASQGETLGVSPRPPGAEPLGATLPKASVYLFQNNKFTGNVMRLGDILATQSGASQRLVKSHSISSAQWNLPPGVVVVLYSKPNGQGRTVVLWGQGQVSSTNQWHFNDKASDWAWYYVGGTGNFRPVVTQVLENRPAGSGPTNTIAPDTIEFFKDSYLRGTMTSISPVTESPANTLQRVGKAADNMSSVCWNLPPGVIVVLYDDSKGKGRQLLLFGSGEYDSVNAWEFNDKLSRWAWYDVGAGR